MSGSNRLTGQLAEEMDKALPAIAALLENQGIPFCIDGGTLLGIVREGRLLPWDDDADFFVRGEDAHRVLSLRWRLFFMGYRISKTQTKEKYGPIPQGAPRIYKIKSLFKSGGQRVIIDLIFKYADERDYHWVVGTKPSVHKKVPRKYYDHFESVTYKGVSYPVPCDVENYLKVRYGDWKKAKKEWDFKKDDQALVSESS